MLGKFDERSALKETRLPEDTPKGKKLEISSQETALPKPRLAPRLFPGAAQNSLPSKPYLATSLSKSKAKGSKSLNLKNLRSKIELLFERIAID